MHFVYGFCDGNANAAVEEYQRCYPERRIPSRGVFTRVQQTLHDYGCLLSVAVQSGLLPLGPHEDLSLRN